MIILVSQGTVSNVDLEASLDLLRQEEVTLAAIEYPSLGKLYTVKPLILCCVVKGNLLVTSLSPLIFHYIPKVQI